MYLQSRCIHCGRCTRVCPVRVGMNLNDPSERVKCNGCGQCVDVCLEKARKNTVTEMTVDEILNKLETQMLFFHNSGGGVTYSGGECTAQPEFLADLVNQVYDMGLNQPWKQAGILT